MTKKLEWREFSREDSMSFAGATGDDCKIADFEMPAEKVRELFAKSDMPKWAIDEMIEICKSEETEGMVEVIAVWADSEDCTGYYVSLEFQGYGGLILDGDLDDVAKIVDSGEFNFTVDYFC